MKHKTPRLFRPRPRRRPRPRPRKFRAERVINATQDMQECMGFQFESGS
jgi:hypothetical protein